MKPFLGETVYWYPHGDRTSTPHVALVTAVSEHTICVSIVLPNAYDLVIKEGVWHLNDQKSRTPELVENGAWDFAPQRLAFIELENRLARLENAAKK